LPDFKGPEFPEKLVLMSSRQLHPSQKAQNGVHGKQLNCRESTSKTTWLQSECPDILQKPWFKKICFLFWNSGPM
jgi:hypothetical protein